MCFDLDSRPPIPPIAGGAIESGEVILDAGDGNRLRAFKARAAEPSGAGILILPDVRGLHRYYEELALRFAEIGIDALAIDYFGRTAGVGPRGGEFDHSAHVAQTHFATLAEDMKAGVAFLRGEDGGSARSVFSIGFCMGGRLAFLSATMGFDLAGVIGFYGWPVGQSRNGSPAPAEVTADMRSPVLAIFGGADQGIARSAVDEFETALERAGVEHELTIHAGAPHGFFDQKAAEFAPQSAAAWDQVTKFIRSRAATH